MSRQQSKWYDLTGIIGGTKQGQIGKQENTSER